MKIVIDCRFWGPKHTGLGRYTQNLVENILKIDKKNEYLLLGESEFSIANCQFQKVSASHYSLEEQLELPRILQKIKPDLVHFPHFNAPLYCPFPMVITIHDLIKHYSKGVRTTTRTPWIYLLKYLGYRTVIRRSILQADKIIVPSQWVKKELLKHFRIEEKKVAVIYEASCLGKPKEKNMEKILKKYNISTPFLLYAGNVYPHKNLRRLILAVKMANRSIVKSQMSLVIVSARSVFLQRLRKEVKELKVEKMVILPGFVPDKELAHLYSEAIAYVSSSLMEGFGLPGIEAMALGCPVICSQIPTFKEIYGLAAVYFDAENVEDMKTKIVKMINLPKKEREELIQRGKRQSQRYSWQRCARETMAVYDEIGTGL